MDFWVHGVQANPVLLHIRRSPLGEGKRSYSLYQAEFSFVYEKFDLYRSLAIPVVGHLDSSLLLRIISDQNRSIIDMQFCVRLQSHA